MSQSVLHSGSGQGCSQGYGGATHHAKFSTFHFPLLVIQWDKNEVLYDGYWGEVHKVHFCGLKGHLQGSCTSPTSILDTCLAKGIKKSASSCYSKLFYFILFIYFQETSIYMSKVTKIYVFEILRSCIKQNKVLLKLTTYELVLLSFCHLHVIQ